MPAEQPSGFPPVRRSRAGVARTDRGCGGSAGEQRSAARPHPTRAELLSRLDELLPDATEGGSNWRAHHLPLSTWSWRPAPGRVLLVGDAAGLINPMTGEGIYYAVATGLLAGRAAAAAIRAGDASAGSTYRREAGRLLGRHLRHTA
ncbi:MAG TPA: FAD-dependent monooxygenase, partial [Kribbella sp.]